MVILIQASLPAIITLDGSTTTVVRFTSVLAGDPVEPAGVVRHPTVQAGLIQHGGHS